MTNDHFSIPNFQFRTGLVSRTGTAFWTVAFVLFLAGCKPGRSALDPSFFPLGIYSVRNTNDFAVIKEAGFNLVTGPAERGFLDAAKAQGLKVLAAPGTSAGPDFAPERAREAVRQFDSHPALWAWYLIDEPDLHNLPPEQVDRANRFVKSLRPTKPTALVLFQGYEARYYANITDILMVDRYPIPWLPLANFGQHVGMARLSLPANKPLIAVIQAFDWNSCPELLNPREENLRSPTETELRCMTYDALARGANGLFYYAFDDGRWKIRDHPETWTALKRVVAEVNARRPLFEGEQLWWAKNHSFADSKHRYNAALESSITSCLLRVRKGNATVLPGDYVLAVNNTAWKQMYSFDLPENEKGEKDESKKAEADARKEEDLGMKLESQKLGARGGELKERGQNPERNTEPLKRQSTTLKILGEEREVPIDSNRVTDDFAPYAIHVYGPL